MSTSMSYNYKNYRRYYLKNKLRFYERVKAYRRKHRHSPGFRFSFAKGNAKTYQHVWKLMIEDYLKIIAEPCFYCHKSLKFECGGSMDRINNRKGYTKENVLPCCGSCNKTRGDRFTVIEMKVMMTALLRYRETH